jgi:hypothetical protein
MNTPLLSFLNNLLKKSNGGLRISVHFWTDMNPAPNRFIQQFFKYRLQHILFWTLYVVFQTIIYQRYDGTGKALINALIVNAFHATAVYFNIYFLIPRLLYHKRYVLYFIMLFCTLFLTAFALLQLILWMEPDTQNLLTRNLLRTDSRYCLYGYRHYGGKGYDLLVQAAATHCSTGKTTGRNRVKVP